MPSKAWYGGALLSSRLHRRQRQEDHELEANLDKKLARHYLKNRTKTKGDGGMT
jgi:hypothetical protein